MGAIVSRRKPHKFELIERDAANPPRCWHVKDCSPTPRSDRKIPRHHHHDRRDHHQDASGDPTFAWFGHARILPRPIVEAEDEAAESHRRSSRSPEAVGTIRVAVPILLQRPQSIFRRSGRRRNSQPSRGSHLMGPGQLSLGSKFLLVCGSLVLLICFASIMQSLAVRGFHCSACDQPMHRAHRIGEGGSQFPAYFVCPRCGETVAL